MRRLSTLTCSLALLLLLPAQVLAQAGERWPAEKAKAWYDKQSWIVGSNFIPSTAINQLEMWQADTFDPKTIDRELGWAADLGFNTMRVFLHDLLWEQDAEGFAKRIKEYLTIADKHKIRTMFVLFDDCWNEECKLGKQPAPKPGVHNSGWVMSPGPKCVTDPKTWPRLEKYVKGVLTAFKDDPRVLLWDLYNEPGNTKLGEKSLPLLHAVFRWARTVNPSQPLSVGVWFDNAKLNAAQFAASDVITFHSYDNPARLKAKIDGLRKYGRPLICTEYMARTQNSKFENCLPVLKAAKVGAINWGLVSGKTNTIYPWGSKSGSPEPKVWFHDIFRADGTPFDAREVMLIKKIVKEN